MIEIIYTTRFKKDLNRVKRRGKDCQKLKVVIEKLVLQESLEPRYRDHALVGNYVDSRECHIEPDWLLIYRMPANQLFLERTGSHSDLF